MKYRVDGMPRLSSKRVQSKGRGQWISYNKRMIKPHRSTLRILYCE